MTSKPKMSSKNFLTTVLLSVFVGWLGVDHFYLGKTRTGIIKLVTVGGIGIWYIVDLVLLLIGKTTDVDGLPLNGRDKWLKHAIILTVAVLATAGTVGAVTYEEPRQVDSFKFPSIFGSKEASSTKSTGDETEAKQVDQETRVVSEKKVSLSQDDAENFCQDAGLLGKYIDLDKVSIISIWNYNVQYESDDATFDKEGYPINNLRWTGKNKDTDGEMRFSCWVSGPKDETVLHWLSIDGEDLQGSADFELYDKDGKRAK